MATLNLIDYTHAAAKAILKRLYKADVQSSLQNKGLQLKGSSIMADAVPGSNGFNITITSSTYEENTLKELVEEGLDAL
jgi:hypothetical protein